jgi:hypothetical protein
MGNTGEGKSHLGHAAIATTYGPSIRLGADGRQLPPDGIFISERDFLNQIRQSYSADSDGEDKLFARLGAARVLVFDDLGAAPVKEASLGWYHGLMTRLMDARSADGRWTLISTNTLDLMAFEALIGARAWSRFKALLGEGQPGEKPWKRSIGFMAGIGDQRDAGRAGTVARPMVTHNPVQMGTAIIASPDGLISWERVLRDEGYAHFEALIATPYYRVRLMRAAVFLGEEGVCNCIRDTITREPDIPPGDLSQHVARVGRLASYTEKQKSGPPERPAHS